MRSIEREEREADADLSINDDLHTTRNNLPFMLRYDYAHPSFSRRHSLVDEVGLRGSYG